MKIVYIIGNGFDLNLGLKTGFTDFFKYYNSLPEINNLITNLKKEINTDIKSWSDLEIQFGQYTKNFNSSEEFDIVYENVGDELSKYLKNQENSISFENVNQDIANKYLCFPEDSLQPLFVNQLKAFKKEWVNSHWNVDIITFNYTNVIDFVFKNSLAKKQIGLNERKNPILLSNIEHLHGFLEERMIFGVDNLAQISNEDFHKNQNVIEAFVKPLSNKASNDIIDNKCIKIISNANLICIFGCSIGESDKTWWKLVAEQLKRNCKLIIFFKVEEEISRRTPYKISRLINKIKDDFIEKAQIKDSNTKEVIYNNIFIGINTNFFSNLINTTNRI